MSEELLQRGLNKSNPTSKIGKWDYYNIGSTTLKALKNAGIIRNVNYGEVENKKVDALIVSKQNVIAVVEFKQPKEFKTNSQQQKAIDQAINVAKILGAKIVIATDTVDNLWINALTGERILDEAGKNISLLFDPANEQLPVLIEKISYSINETNNQLLSPKLVNPTCLASSVWQDVWSVSGATPENCLYTFVELFIFKYLSDLGILKSRNSFYSLMEMYATDTHDEVLIFYVDNVRKKIKELFPYNPLDNTTIINGSIFVSKDQKAVAGYSTVFFKVLDKFNKYGRLDHIDYDFKSKLFESFLKESISKKNWGQYFTPIKVVRAIETIICDEIKEGTVICDPACGVRKFLLEPIKGKLDRFYKVEGNKIIPKITILGFDKGFDKDEQRTIILAKANMLIYFSEIIKNYPNHTKEFAELFNSSFILKTDSILGTLNDPVENMYDLILTNPPYVMEGSSNLKEEIQKNNDLKKYYKVNAIGVEGLFMEWIIKALKPNGKAFIIVPDGIFERQNDKNLRMFLLQECFIDGIISLPTKTFFTTTKKTYILCITKKNNKVDIQNDPVFTYLVSEIGESRDVYRFDIEQNDLVEATTLYNFFKGNKKAFKSINNDPRCKIVSIKKFELDTHWSIDRWWSKEEKVALGIQEEDKEMSILEFSSLISDMADNFKSFSTVLKEEEEKKNLKIDKQFLKFKLNELFHIKSGNSKFTKRYLDRNKGKYPVYSSNTKKDGLFGMIDSFDYDTECIQITTNGVYAGTVFYRKKHKFNINADARLLIKKNDYLIIELQKTLSKQHFNWENKPTIGKISTIDLTIPVNANGLFDLRTQQYIAEQHNIITEIKVKAKEYEQLLKESIVTAEDTIEIQSKEVKIDDIFDLPSIKGITKSFINANKGTVPVYGGKKDEKPIGYIKDNLPNVAYFENCLAWNREGSVGYVFYHKNKFTTNDHHRPMIIKEEYIQILDIEYMRYAIEKVLLSQGFKWSKTASKEKVANLSVSIPITSTGKFDIEKQQEIIATHKKIEEIKNSTFDELKKIQEYSLII